jgi:hypothetical protein
MHIHAVPDVFSQLQRNESICVADLANTLDGFWMIRRSLAEILASKGIMDFPDANGARLACDKFYDDWFLYAVPDGGGYVFSLLKLREQEYDAKGSSPADGDIPGVTISFVPFACEALTACIAAPTDENRKSLDCEIDRVAARRGQRHCEELKRYFINPKSEGAYLVANLYGKQIASFAIDGALDVPKHYGEIAKNKKSRLPAFIELLNQAAGRVICDHKKIYFENVENLTEHERMAILATHTGNTSLYSFAAEVEFHARFLTPLAKIKIPFLGKSFYDSAIRADMTIGDAKRGRFAPYYRENSKIVQRQYRLHKIFDGGNK